MNAIHNLMALTLCFTAVVFAQSTSPYAGQHSQNIKALSSDEIAGYLNGAGMGMAKAAELNHYPGPKHVLDLSESLHLTEAQRQQTLQIYKTMKKTAIRLGKQLIEKEQELDQLFARGTIDENRLQSLVMEIGNLYAALRLVHLTAHLKQKQILTAEQIQLYDQLRGYNQKQHQQPLEHSH